MNAVTIAQISDLHIGTGRSRVLRFLDHGEALSRCIAKINAVGADLVIATGDLTHDGSLAEYRRLRELLAELHVPYYLLPGNHDDRQALRSVFSDHPYLFETSPHIDFTIDVKRARIIALDSTQPQRIGGYLDESRFRWLREQLEETPQRPTILALHHPPFQTGVWPMDKFRFVNSVALSEILEQNPHIQRVVSGHVHCVRTARFGNALACTSPAPFDMPLLRTNAKGRLLPAYERGGFLVHSCDQSDRFTTCVVRVKGDGLSELTQDVSGARSGAS